jgi:hypothetical protein
MVSIIKYLFEFDSEAMASVAKNQLGDDSSKLSKFAKKLYDMSHDPETGASHAGRIFRTEKAVGLEDSENKFKLAKAISKDHGKNPEVVKQWASFLKR